jgi:hypothetical protein
MSRRLGSSPRLPVACHVIGCIRDPLGRRRIETALRDSAVIEWCATFAALRTHLSVRVGPTDIAVFDRQDSTGASADALARDLAKRHPGIGLVAYMPPPETDGELCLLGAAGVHDLLIPGRTDEGFRARTILLGVRRRGAADRVMLHMEPLVPDRLLDFVATVLASPDVRGIAEVTARMGVHRQTPNAWCRRSAFLSAEELFSWSRVLLVSALLESTSRTVESIAYEFNYASATALRNQLKRYTAMTATGIRLAGLTAVARIFRGRIDQCRVGLTGRHRPAMASPHARATEALALRR